MRILKRAVVVCIPLIVCAELYLRLIQGETRVGWTGLKVFTLLGLLVFPAITEIVAFRGFWHESFLHVLLVNLLGFALLSLFVCVDAFTRYPGLAKDLDRTAINFLRLFLFQWVLIGFPLGLMTSAIVKLLGKYAPGHI